MFVGIQTRQQLQRPYVDLAMKAMKTYSETIIQHTSTSSRIIMLTVKHANSKEKKWATTGMFFTTLPTKITNLPTFEINPIESWS